MIFRIAGGGGTRAGRAGALPAAAQGAGAGGGGQHRQHERLEGAQAEDGAHVVGEHGHGHEVDGGDRRGAVDVRQTRGSRVVVGNGVVDVPAIPGKCVRVR